jgi:molybdate transport system regulatory protein
MPDLSLLAQHVTRRPQRVVLLTQIAQQGSITRAAKAANMSYKAAWDAIDELNNLADQPLVIRTVGGKGGGGARLTTTGERLLAVYERLQSIQMQVLEAVGNDADLQLLGRLMLRTSARNQLAGKVHAITTAGFNDLIDIDLPGGLQIRAQITHSSTQKLLLQPGSTLVALIKAGALQLSAARPQDTAQSNRLPGRIEQIVAEQDGSSEVRICLENGQILYALATLAELEAQGLHNASHVRVQFTASQILLGTQA